MPEVKSSPTDMTKNNILMNEILNLHNECINCSNRVTYPIKLLYIADFRLQLEYIIAIIIHQSLCAYNCG
jgi:hypothetical protein